MPSDTFAAALLNPELPVPDIINGKAERRFAVYRNNVVVGLVRAMERNFPACRRLLGEVYFAGLAREFVMQHPPQSPLMFAYGSEFPEFIGAQHDLSGYPYLADVSRLEIFMRQSHHATDAPVLEPEVFESVPEVLLGNVVLKPHPAMRLLASEFAVVAITLSNRLDGAGLVNRPDVAEWALATRPQLDVVLTALSHAQFVFIESLAKEHGLADAAATAFEIDNSFDLASTLGLALSCGAFTSLEQQEYRE